MRKRAAAWVETRIRLGLSELMDAKNTAEMPAGARGIVFQLCESLGVLPRQPIEQQIGQLGEEDRKMLAKLGVRVGVFSLYFPSMLKPVPIRLRAGLWMIARNRDTIPPLPPEGRTSMDLPPNAERDFYAAIGYLPLGGHGIRADMVERLAAMARHAVRDSREAARRDAARRAQAQEKSEIADKPETAEKPVEATAVPRRRRPPTRSANGRLSPHRSASSSRSRKRAATAGSCRRSPATEEARPKNQRPKNRRSRRRRAEEPVAAAEAPAEPSRQKSFRPRPPRLKLSQLKPHGAADAAPADAATRRAEGGGSGGRESRRSRSPGRCRRAISAPRRR